MSRRVRERSPYEIVMYQGAFHPSSIEEFEDLLFRMAEQEERIDKPGIWTKVADMYVTHLHQISMYPYPQELEVHVKNDRFPPTVEHITINTDYLQFYRWGIEEGGRTGNHRIIYAIHNYNKVVLLHHFDKQYNGVIRREDIEPAEENYDDYCFRDLSHYPVK